MLFLPEHFEAHLISKETNIDINNGLCIKDDFASDIAAHRFTQGFIASAVTVARSG
jgi:hypothetical protein